MQHAHINLWHDSLQRSWFSTLQWFTILPVLHFSSYGSYSDVGWRRSENLHLICEPYEHSPRSDIQNVAPRLVCLTLHNQVSTQCSAFFHWSSFVVRLSAFISAVTSTARQIKISLLSASKITKIHSHLQCIRLPVHADSFGFMCTGFAFHLFLIPVGQDHLNLVGAAGSIETTRLSPGFC